MREMDIFGSQWKGQRLTVAGNDFFLQAVLCSPLNGARRGVVHCWSKACGRAWLCMMVGEYKGAVVLSSVCSNKSCSIRKLQPQRITLPLGVPTTLE